MFKFSVHQTYFYPKRGKHLSPKETVNTSFWTCFPNISLTWSYWRYLRKQFLKTGFGKSLQIFLNKFLQMSAIICLKHIWGILPKYVQQNIFWKTSRNDVSSEICCFFCSISRESLYFQKPFLKYLPKYFIENMLGNIDCTENAP